MIGDLSDCQLQSHSRATHLPALQARHRGQYPPPPEGSERGSAPCRHTDLSADWRHLRPLAAAVFLGLTDAARLAQVSLLSANFANFSGFSAREGA